MSEPSPALPLASKVTQMITAIESGDRVASEELLPLVYEALRKLARSRVANLPAGQTLQATALVHEAYLRLADSDGDGWSGKGHFFAAAAESMRRIIIDNIRKKRSKKHGGEFQRVEFDELKLHGVSSDEELLELNEWLLRLRESHPEAAQVVNLRFFAGLTLKETALAMGMAERTVKRRWAFARAWLYREMKGETSGKANGEDD